MIASVESRNAGVTKTLDVADVRDDFLSQRRIACEQSETDEEMRLTATHGLFEMEHSR